MTAEYLPATGLAELGEQAETLSGRGECNVNRKSTQWIICTQQFNIFSDQQAAQVIYLSRQQRLIVEHFTPGGWDALMFQSSFK